MNTASSPAILLALVLAGHCAAAPSVPVRIKDIATVAGTTGQKLMGYGLVVGLEGTGDSTRSPLAAQALANMLEHFDLKVTTAQLATQNVAAVIVTAALPVVAREGDRVDVSVASVADAKSIYGGILLPTPLRGNDDQVHVMAQGSVSIGGFNVGGGGGQRVQRNHPLAGRVVDGGTVLRGVAPAQVEDRIHLTLRQPDFTTALRMSEAINLQLGADCARAVAAESIEIMVPTDRLGDLVGFIAEIETLPVMGDTAARVVVNERTGTIIIGGDVRILPVAVAHGSLTITITRHLDVSQPLPFTGGTTVLDAGARAGEPPDTPEPEAAAAAGGPGQAAAPGEVAPLPGARTVVTPRTELQVHEAEASLVEIVPQTRLSDLVEALNALGVKPRDLIAILQALKAANALQAELVLM